MQLSNGKKKKKAKKLRKKEVKKNVQEVEERCAEWIGKRSRRKIGLEAIDFFPLTGNKPPFQTVAPLCFEAAANLAGFLAAAVIRNLARINRSYSLSLSLFLSRFERERGAWFGSWSRIRSNGRRKCFLLPESEERVENRWLRCCWRKYGWWPVYVHDDTFVIRDNKRNRVSRGNFARYRRVDLSNATRPTFSIISSSRLSSSLNFARYHSFAKCTWSFLIS